ncbi:Thioesterase/thiol ester dehydrase-isomerase [Dacryopinax primogenitus]|uniref:Thioesterase/thiol ester dehydrase-isomerase n=1 Tax=Dacryopinax primogenitus (strain DJM 731) TaxID=1858805 RepID=M5FNW5_DACPD|nr:Thioesterase/thiol ester dehydrase-isomerase [Dacryopinax primogenitus]EJT96603.1 Thioesterase/thiol ester dehydrase-isomerase [Dacryopinax primogenitus]
MAFNLSNRCVHHFGRAITGVHRQFSYSVLRSTDKDHKLHKLYQSFSDPTTPYYMGPGEVGPSDPNDPPIESMTYQEYKEASAPHGRKKEKPPADTAPIGKAHADQAPPQLPPGTRPLSEEERHSLINGQMAGSAAAVLHLKEEGFDLDTAWEQSVAWGDLDSFRHLNNVKYIKYFESGRMRLTQRLGEQIGGTKLARDMMEARGVSIILKSIDVKFKRPVTYPDTLLIAHKPHSFAPTQFTLSCIAYSFTQSAPVCTAEAVCVWYDYDVWKKCIPPPELYDALRTRAPKERD